MNFDAKKFRDIKTMSCEEFELRGLDIDRNDVNPLEAAAAKDHARFCANCSALLASWRELKGDLRLLRDETRMNAAPMRVEMRLKQELRTRREARIPRSSVAIGSWALAAAAVLVASVGWVRTHTKNNDPKAVNASVSAPSDTQMLLAADYDTGEFTQLPGSLSGDVNDQSILQVRMQRGGLEHFGLPVDPERASEVVDVDFLVGEDGQPQAVRLHQGSESGTAKQ
jgi:hypothetical protein